MKLSNESSRGKICSNEIKFKTSLKEMMYDTVLLKFTKLSINASPLLLSRMKDELPLIQNQTTHLLQHHWTGS